MHKETLAPSLKKKKKKLLLRLKQAHVSRRRRCTDSGLRMRGAIPPLLLKEEQVRQRYAIWRIYTLGNSSPLPTNKKRPVLCHLHSAFLRYTTFNMDIRILACDKLCTTRRLEHHN